MQLAVPVAARGSVVFGFIALAILAASLPHAPAPRTKSSYAAAWSAFESTDGAEQRLRTWLIRP